jgi:peptide-N4-(N-acetyl-beta-glucosaminyl)asparagine amidase
MACLTALVAVAMVFGQTAQALTFDTNVWNEVGSATIDGGVLTLTEDGDNDPDAGAAWLLEKQRIDRTWVMEFDFAIPAVSGAGADGFAFVIQNAGSSALGQGGLGYGGIRRSVAVEFDTFVSGGQFDVTDNDIGVHTRGTRANNVHERYSLGTTEANVDMSDGLEREVEIRYDSEIRRLFVEVDDQYELSVPLNIKRRLDSRRAFIGFTGSVDGPDTQTVEISNWSFEELV